MKNKILLILLLLPFLGGAQGRADYSLNGEWSFALDPVKVGENNKWFSPDFPFPKFDKVTVPHSYSVDPRYMFYTGQAWYFKKFRSPTAVDSRVLLRFDAVFYKCKLWLNGVVIGSHEGGYTPFEIDITKEIKAENTLAVLVDNSWDSTTIPGAKTYIDFQDQNASQLVPWINYGGLTRRVSLLVRPAVYIRNLKIVAEPAQKGNATVRVSGFVKNSSAIKSKLSLTANIFFHEKRINAVFRSNATEIGAGEESRIELTSTIPSTEVRLWNQDEPNLYNIQLSYGTDTITKSFGFRKIEVRGTSLLLNGSPIKMGGCNRPLDYPGYGSLDPAQVLEQDMTLIKNGSMELSRISHYPVSEALLDWADKNGMLIITEAGNWQLTPRQLSDTAMRRKFRSQFREMIEHDWNHPSVIAYSVGNEFQSHTEEGKAWVRDMRDYARSLDSSRLITFASMFVARDIIKKPEDEASQYVDFISANMYGNYLKNLRHIHEIYPGKPVYVSEFGIRTDGVKSEEDRILHLTNAVRDFRQCDFVIGASVWTFNDYFSRFPGTGANGYRPWGLVSPHREVRGMYRSWQEEFSPAIIELAKRDGEKVFVNVIARKDFPSYTLKGYVLKHNDRLIPIPTLQPGEQKQVTLVSPGNSIEVQLLKPGGFVVLSKTLK